jgi:hypothetical protein
MNVKKVQAEGKLASILQQTKRSLKRIKKWRNFQQEKNSK